MIRAPVHILVGGLSDFLSDQNVENFDKPIKPNQIKSNFI